MFFRRVEEEKNVVPVPPVEPIFTGLAEPGSTIKLTVYDRDGNVIGVRDVMADSAGNWVASFSNRIMFRSPHHMTAEVTPSVHGTSDNSGFNLRRYFMPTLNGSLFLSQRVTVASVVRETPHTVLSSLHEANHNPLGFGWNASAYESAAASTNSAQQ
jgi:hypothetical protein